MDAIKVLADLGASVNTPANDGYTPVFIVAPHGHVDAIKALTALGASVNTPANDGYTPVLVASQCGHVAAIKLLYKLGADFGCYTFPSGQKCSVLDVAEAADQQAAVDLIKGILSSRCQKVRYCSLECQVKDHKKHRSECIATQAARASTSSDEPSATASVATVGST